MSGGISASHNGLSYRKPVGIPHKFSAEAQQVFMEIYNQLKQKASDDKPILFIDGVHPIKGTKLAQGWMPAGKKAQPVETTGSRTHLNIMGALNLNYIGSTVVREYDSINSLNIALRETYPIRQKVHIVLDDSAYHRTVLVKEQADMMNINLHYLPSYSHNLNPIERLWKLMNKEMKLLLRFTKGVSAANTPLFSQQITGTSRALVAQDQ